MKKILSLVMVCIAAAFIAGCCSCPKKNSSKLVQIPDTRGELTTKWTTYDFSKYDEKSVKTIYDRIVKNDAYRVQVTYDKNEALAKKVLAGIQSNINYYISLKHKPMNGDGNLVVVTVYNQDKGE